MKKNIFMPCSVLIFVLLAVLFFVTTGFLTKEPVSKVNLALMSVDSPGPGLNVYVYRYHDGRGGYYQFAIAERNYKDGVAITQLK
jgi:hypothetical protein